MDAAQNKFIRMTTEPVNKLVCRLAVPTIISMLVTSLYNMADTFFVGQVGTEATAGVGLIFPVMAIIQAFGFYFGQGSGNFISRALGAQKKDEAEIMSATGFFCSMLLGCVLMLIGFVFKPQILTLLGASEATVSPATVGYADDYLTFILIAAPFTATSFVLNNQLRFQGNAMFSMIGLVTGAVINCILDPLLIFGLDLEVTGAALATAISQFISFCILYVATLKSDSMKIRLRNFRIGMYWQKGMFTAGAPALFRQGLASFATLALNSAAAIGADPAMADAAIAAFSVVGKVMMFAFSALLGFGQGFQPVCGYNYGAKKYDRVRASYMFCLKVGGMCLFVLSALGFIFAEPVISLFRDDPAVIAIGTVAMRWQCCTFPLMAVVACTNMLYQNIGRVVGATLLAVARQGLMFIPVVLVLPHLFAEPIWGVYLAQPAADLFAFALAVPLAVRMYRELRHLEEERKNEE